MTEKQEKLFGMAEARWKNHEISAAVELYREAIAGLNGKSPEEMDDVDLWLYAACINRIYYCTDVNDCLLSSELFKASGEYFRRGLASPELLEGYAFALVLDFQHEKAFKLLDKMLNDPEHVVVALKHISSDWFVHYELITRTQQIEYMRRFIDLTDSLPDKKNKQHALEITLRDICGRK